jgi:hypothetical protein
MTKYWPKVTTSADPSTLFPALRRKKGEREAPQYTIQDISETTAQAFAKNRSIS